MRMAHGPDWFDALMTAFDPNATLLTRRSITSSARARSDGGTVSPSALAVFKLTLNETVVGCSTGISAGFDPLSGSTCVEARTNLHIRVRAVE
jgi:hypothetical protein